MFLTVMICWRSEVTPTSCRWGHTVGGAEELLMFEDGLTGIWSPDQVLTSLKPTSRIIYDFRRYITLGDFLLLVPAPHLASLSSSLSNFFGFSSVHHISLISLVSDWLGEMYGPLQRLKQHHYSAGEENEHSLTESEKIKRWIQTVKVRCGGRSFLKRDVKAFLLQTSSERLQTHLQQLLNILVLKVPDLPVEHPPNLNGYKILPYWPEYRTTLNIRRPWLSRLILRKRLW